jgi:serine/threonine-protein kinase
MPTGDGAVASPALAPPVSRISSDSIRVGGFAPGAVLAGRYRIIGLLGRGGMGEVYRADDLKLGQPVALKFLPQAFAADPVRRERFFAEVRITRQLSHPNICRVYDIAEYEGQHFLSMEYIDGEDLASLIKRIGYLSNEKALEITRQLVAGLSAAHERGVLHRDLKPANIMIDGHGRVRITDFGLAIDLGDDAPENEIFGTPAYMAPEQFAGKGASVRSDIYALGLILYEIYSGKRAFTATTLVQIREQKDGHTPTAPSELRSGLDPVVERLIMRCLERDPRLRPASVAQLAIALPGGDPLAAAIAAGETPSPEMVAASGLKEGLRPAIGIALVGFIIAGSIGLAWLRDRTELLQLIPGTKSRDVLIEKAQEIIREAGYTDPPADSAIDYSVDAAFSYLEASGRDASRWKNLKDLNPVRFMYRQSPQWFERLSTLAVEAPSPPRPRGVVGDDPPMHVSGEVLLYLDSEGRLRFFQAIPAQTESAATPATSPDWSSLFSNAGLEFSEWKAVAPQRTPLFFADQRAAWQGSLSSLPTIPLRVEAASYRGKLIYFEIMGPWSVAARETHAPQRPGANIANIVGAAVLLSILAGGVFFARRNVHLGRGDRRSALRIALFTEALVAVSWIFAEHHVPTGWEGSLFGGFVGYALSMGGLLWVVYVAVEPYVRRRWPHTLITWTRLLSGEFRDPLVGRDILIGCAGGIALNLERHSRAVITTDVFSLIPMAFNGLAGWISQLCSIGTSAIIGGIFSLFLIFALRLITRSDKATMAVVVLILSAPLLVQAIGAGARIEPLSILLFFSIWVLLLMRFGLLSMCIGLFAFDITSRFPLTLQSSAWYSSQGYAAIAVVLALALYGFRTCLGSRPILDLAAVED